MSYSRLYRSTTSRVFGGVAGGIAEYFNMDPVIIRIIFVLAAIFGGGGVIIYLVLWIAVPERPFTSTMFNKEASPGSDTDQENPSHNGPNPTTDAMSRNYTGSLIGGIILIGIGALILAGRVIPNIYFRDLWPFVLVVAGIVLIVSSMNQPVKKD
jgi:phage shock protein C